MSPKNQVKTTTMPQVDKAKPVWREMLLNSGILLSSVLVEVGQCASVVGLQHAAQAIFAFLSTIEKVQANKEDFEIIAKDASELVVAVWRAQEKAKNPTKWLSSEIRDMVADLRKTLLSVNKIAERQTKRTVVVRVIFALVDSGQIRHAREKINAAIFKFQVLSHLNLTDLLHEVIVKQEALAEQMKNRNDADNIQAEEEDDDDDDNDDNDNDEEEQADEAESAPAVSRKNARPPRARSTAKPSVFPNSARIQGFSFTNNGSGRIYNHNVGNIVTTTYSNVGNNRSQNYIYD